MFATHYFREVAKVTKFVK